MGSEYKNTEWLYDLHWDVEVDEPYKLKKIPLVVECEWKAKSKKDSKEYYSGIKYDFRKLLVANADLRLMIFLVKSEKDILVLDKYFDEAIDLYENLAPGSKFLFIAFEQGLARFHYTAKQKEK